ncbi:MAG TPA: DUF2971 domain-containing protein [Ignavibacteriales bacterium]|nr:DUF2971 domain-containing protein [Ignavibacteriales bacterium]
MEIIKNKRIAFDDNDFLWKYLDLHKFLSFVLNKKLFFNRLDNLEDPLEGLPEATLSYMDEAEQFDNQCQLEALPSADKRKLIADRNKKASLAARKIEESQQTQFANCWYMGKKESFAMWNIYSNPESVAIRYRPKELIDMIIPSAENFHNKDFTQLIYGYVDYDDIWPFEYTRPNSPKIKFAAFRKDSSYKHEQEFRFVTVIATKNLGKYVYFELPLSDIDKDSFQVLANPYMEGWKYNNIKKFLEQNGLEHRLSQSVLKVKK